MTIKKSLLAAATVTTVAVAGTGVPAAQSSELPTGSSDVQTKQDTEEPDDTETDDPDDTDDEDEDDENGDTDLLGSIEGSTEVLTIINDFGGAVAGSISILPDINDAVSDFQDMIDDIAGNLPPLPFP